MRKLPRIAALLGLLALAGCGSLINLGAQVCAIYPHPRIYGGVRIDVVHLLPDDFPLGLLCALLDLPFCLAMDTLTLPWSIPATVEYGDTDAWPEPSRPHAILDGVVIHSSSSGYRVVTMMEIWGPLPPEMEPLSGTRASAVLKEKGLEKPIAASGTSDARGHVRLHSAWEEPWKLLRFECEGFEPVEIPVNELHSPTDQSYWGDHRMLILMKPR